MKTEIKKVELTYTQKKELKALYGSYKSAKSNEFTTREEAKQQRQDDIKELIEKYPEIVKLICSEYKCEENSAILYLDSYIYSDNQKKFIKDAEECDLEIDYTYSGRGMFGDVCPAVRCDSHNDLTTKAKTKIDGMGLGIVIYAEY